MRAAGLTIAIVGVACSFQGAAIESDAIDSSTNDADGVDGSMAPAACVAAAANDLISAWSMSADGNGRIVDEFGVEDARPVGSPQRVAGAVGCGDAATFSPAAGFAAYRVSDKSEWDMVRSIDLLALLPNSATQLSSIVSHDFEGQNPGDVSIYFWQVAGGQPVVFVRAQREDASVIRCAVDFPRDRWFHLGVNLAPVELWIDGVAKDDLQGSLLVSMGGGRCGDATGDVPLAGSQNYWVFGATNHAAEQPSDQTLGFPLSFGALDNVRFGGTARDFSGVVAPATL